MNSPPSKGTWDSLVLLKEVLYKKCAIFVVSLFNNIIPITKLYINTNIQWNILEFYFILLLHFPNQTLILNGGVYCSLLRRNILVVIRGRSNNKQS